MAAPLSFPADLSAAVVAFTIEADNEAAHRLAHTTTSFGATGPRGSVWMTSIAMWFNCLRWLRDGEELTVAELERRARMPTNLDGMRRWGYTTIDGVGRVKRGDPRPKPKSSSGLAITRRGRAAADVWRSLPGEIEGRWRERFGAGAVDRLRAALGGCWTAPIWRCPSSCRWAPCMGSGSAIRNRASPAATSPASRR